MKTDIPRYASRIKKTEVQIKISQKREEGERVTDDREGRE